MNARSLVSLCFVVLALLACLVGFPAAAGAQTGIGPIAAARAAARSNRDLVRQNRADAIASRNANVDLLRSTSFAPQAIRSSCALRSSHHAAPLVAAPLLQTYTLPAAIVAPPVYAAPLYAPAPLVAPLIVPGYSLPAVPLPAPAPLVAPPAAIFHPTRAESPSALHAARALVVPRCSF